MKWLFILLLTLVSAITFVLFSLQDPGFIMVGRGQWSIETSLSLFLVMLTATGIFIYHLIHLIAWLGHLPSYFFSRRALHHQHQSIETLTHGLFSLMQGQYTHAEQTLLKTPPTGELFPLLYLGAGYAAYQLREPVRANDHFNEVRIHLPKEDLALSLGEARLQLQNQNLLAALKNILHVHALVPKHQEALLLLMSLYLQLADWPALLELLPEIRKHKLLPPEQLQRLENRVSIALIDYTLRTHPLQAATLWSRIPKATRLRPPVLKAYIQHLMATGDAVTAEPLLRESLKYHWDTELILWYGNIETPDTKQQINYAEGWLKGRETDYALLLTLGRLCMRGQLWGKAQQYLETSLHSFPTPLTYQSLGDLSIQMENINQAYKYYRQGLQWFLE